MKTKLASAK